MAKKPSLALVDRPLVNSPTPPATLGATGRELWQSITSEYDFSDAPGRQLLQQICEAADRLSECREVIARDGLLIETKGGAKDHPLLRHELAARAFIARSLQRLGVNLEAVKPIGRPAKW
jgi:P27 family predicted phage terminase small subunit